MVLWKLWKGMCFINEMSKEIPVQGRKRKAWLNNFFGAQSKQYVWNRDWTIFNVAIHVDEDNTDKNPILRKLKGPKKATLFIFTALNLQIVSNHKTSNRKKVKVLKFFAETIQYFDVRFFLIQLLKYKANKINKYTKYASTYARNTF